VLNHFHDPYYDRGLTVGGVALGLTAATWALEESPGLPFQEHSFDDARKAFYNGLVQTAPDLRTRELGHMFYSLGHVIHLIQDITIPEHTRNDAHLSGSSGKSLFEGYLNRNVRTFTPTHLKLSAVPIPVVALARELWASSAGIGLAQFTNSNFVSPDTNFSERRTGATAAEYPGPVLDVARRDTRVLGRCKDMEQPVPPPQTLIFYGNVMPDPLRSTPTVLTNPRMTAHSALDQYLEDRGKGLLFSINCFTIDAAAELLLPRAASYSAGLLKYFFRGRPTVLLGGGGMRIINRTVDVGRAEAMTGRFELYRDDALGRRQLLAGWDLSLLPDVTSGALSVPLLPDGDTSRCILVFRGRIGDELDGVAGQQLDRCPTAAGLAAPAVELGLDIGVGPSSGGSVACNMQGWMYLLEACCGPGEPPHFVSRCATTVAGAIAACHTSSAFFYVCRLPS
jgi:hypothetical protein